MAAAGRRAFRNAPRRIYSRSAHAGFRAIFAGHIYSQFILFCRLPDSRRVRVCWHRRIADFRPLPFRPGRRVHRRFGSLALRRFRQAHYSPARRIYSPGSGLLIPAAQFVSPRFHFSRLLRSTFCSVYSAFALDFRRDFIRLAPGAGRAPRFRPLISQLLAIPGIAISNSPAIIASRYGVCYLPGSICLYFIRFLPYSGPPVLYASNNLRSQLAYFRILIPAFGSGFSGIIGPAGRFVLFGIIHFRLAILCLAHIYYYCRRGRFAHLFASGHINLASTADQVICSGNLSWPFIYLPFCCAFIVLLFWRYYMLATSAIAGVRPAAYCVSRRAGGVLPGAPGWVLGRAGLFAFAGRAPGITGVSSPGDIISHFINLL